VVSKYNFTIIKKNLPIPGIEPGYIGKTIKILNSEIFEIKIKNFFGNF